jgi:ATP-dependent Clp protease ATP-binding subunit ClpA
MLSGELEACLNQAFHQARSARHEFLTVEHLLLAILDTPKVREVLAGCGADLDQLGIDLKQHVETKTSQLTPGEEREVQPAIGFQRVLQRAVFHVQSSGRKEVGVVNVLVAIFSEKQSHAVFLLARGHITRLDVVKFISGGLAVTPKAEFDVARMPKADLDAAGLDRLVEMLISLRKSIDQAARNDEEERADSRELIDDLISAAHAARPNGMKLRGLLAGLASGAAARVESQAWSQVRDAAIALDLWIIQ